MSHTEEHEIQESSDNSPWINNTKNSKRKQQRTNENERSDSEDVTLIDRNAQTTTATNGGQLFRNSRSRTNNRQNISPNDSSRIEQYPFPKRAGNYTNPEKERNEDETRSEKRAVTNVPHNHAQDGPNERNKVTNDLHITQHAMQYAIEHHLPFIHIECQPKVENQSKGKEIIRALLAHVEKDFRTKNMYFSHPMAFDYWFIDKQGNLTSYSRHTELYVYLCDSTKYPESVVNTKITPRRPNHLPAQQSLVLKFIPTYITTEEVEKEINIHVNSLFKIEEMRGSKTEKSRHMRIELTSSTEYEKLLTRGELAIDGQLIEVAEFLAPPRLLICSKCNDPGHMRKNCGFEYEACRRCGEDRTKGDHKECTIKCHRCQQSHLSTDYRCQYIIDFRRALLQRLKESPNLLPPNIRIFIPTDCRDRGTRRTKVLTNPTTADIDEQTRKNETNPQFQNQAHEWPYLPNRWDAESNQPKRNNVWECMKNKHKDIDELRDEINDKLKKYNEKHNEHMKKLNIIITTMSHMIKHQNENIERCYTTINEVIPILSSTLVAIRRVALVRSTPNLSSENNKDIQEVLNHVSQTIEHLGDRNDMLIANQKQLSEAIENQRQMMMEGINEIATNND